MVFTSTKSHLEIVLLSPCPIGNGGGKLVGTPPHSEKFPEGTLVLVASGFRLATFDA
jgi:hypothetical protein